MKKSAKSVLYSKVSEQQRSVVITDVHGYSDKLREAVDYYGEDTRYIMGGDFINKGPDSKGVMDILSGLDTVLLAGNHEWVLFASLDDMDPERRRIWSEEMWLRSPRNIRMEKRFLESYGIPEYRKVSDTQQATKEKLQELGHYAMFAGMELYYEDDEMVVVHAGLKRRKSWVAQRASLDEAARLKDAHLYLREIPQLNSANLSHKVLRPQDLGKTLITGHTRPNGNGQRLWSNGWQTTRVMLDSSLSGGGNLLVYEPWNAGIKSLHSDEGSGAPDHEAPAYLAER